MRARLQKYWDRISSSFWFLPSLLVVGAVAVAWGAVAIDEVVTERWLRTWGWGYTGSPQGATALLGAIAGSMITVAGLVFSLTLVALTLASSQFGPRLLRNFMRDATNQFVLGTFVATFLYCLLVLRTIRGTDGETFVPHLSISLAVLLAVGNVAVLIYFIHHVAMSIQADELVARLGAELVQRIDRLFPEPIDPERPRSADQPGALGLPEDFERDARPIRSAEDGYLQYVDPDELVATAQEGDLVLRVLWTPRHYVVADEPLVLAWPAERLTDALADRARSAFVLGNQRTPAQDVEFVIDQLVEVAVRALSPGVNDPFTAIRCIDRLGSALSRLVRREMPSRVRRDAAGRVRVVGPPVTFPMLADTAFHQLRQNARTSAAVTIRLLEMIDVVAGFATRPEDRLALRRHAEMIAAGARDGLPEVVDRQAVEERLAAVQQRLDSPKEPAP